MRLNREFIDENTRGILLVLASSAVWAAGGVFSKYGLRGVEPTAVTIVTALIIVIVALTFFRPKQRQLLCAFSKRTLLFLGLALVGVVLAFVLSNYAIKHIPLGIAVLLQRSKPIFIALFAALLLKERIKQHQIPWLILAMLASVFLAIPNIYALQSNSYVLGVLAMLLAALCFGLNAALNKLALNEEFEIGTILVLRFSIGGGVLLFVMLAGLTDVTSGEANLSHWMATLVGALLGSLGFILYYKSLRILPVTVVGSWELTTGVFSVALGSIFFGEQLSWIQLSLIPTLLISLIFFSRCRSPQEISEYSACASSETADFQ